MSWGFSVYDGSGVLTTDSDNPHYFSDSITSNVSTTTALTSDAKFVTPETSCSIFRQSGREPSGFTTYPIPSSTGVNAVNLLGGKRKSCMRTFTWGDFLFADDDHMRDKYLADTRTTNPATVIGMSEDDQTNYTFGAMLYTNNGKKLISERYLSYTLLQEATGVTVQSSVPSTDKYQLNSFYVPQTLAFVRPLDKPPLILVRNTSVPVALFGFVKDTNGKYTGVKIVCPLSYGPSGFPIAATTYGVCDIRVYTYAADVPIPTYGMSVYDENGVLTYHSGCTPLRFSYSNVIHIPVFVDASGRYNGYGFADIYWRDDFVAQVDPSGWAVLVGHPLVGCITVPMTVDFWYHNEVFLGVFVYNNAGTAKILLRPTTNCWIYYYSGWICMLNYAGVDYEAWLAIVT